MDQEAIHEENTPAEVPHHHKPKHIAEKLESYVVIAMGVVGAVLLVMLIYYFMQTGTGTPSWMR
jgi:hypothetical protein